MSMELLQALADAEMPLEIVNPAVQQKLKVLHQAGFIICSFPAAGTVQPQAACVHMVTVLGDRALRCFGPIPRMPDWHDLWVRRRSAMQKPAETGQTPRGSAERNGSRTHAGTSR